MLEKALLLHFEDEASFLQAINTHLFAYQGSDKLHQVHGCDNIDDFFDFLVEHDDDILYESLESLLLNDDSSPDHNAYLNNVLFYAYKLDGARCLPNIVKMLLKEGGLIMVRKILLIHLMAYVRLRQI